MRRPKQLQPLEIFSKYHNITFMQPYQSLSEYINNIATERAANRTTAELVEYHKEGFKLFDTIYEQHFFITHRHFFAFLFERGIVAHCEEYDAFLLNLLRNKVVLLRLNEFYWTENLKEQFARKRDQAYTPNLFYFEASIPVSPTIEAPFPLHDPYEYMN